MAGRSIVILATRPSEGGCNLCSVVIKNEVIITPEAETTLSIGHQQSRLCRKHLVKLEKVIRRWRKNLTK